MYSELIINSNYLVNINDVYTSGFSINFLEFLSILAIISSILVITNKNPILSVLFLISLFLTISIYLIMIGLNFIGISYLLVYIGAVSMLFLFILMLIDIRVSELHADNNNSLFLSFVIGILFYFITTSNTIINIYDMFLYNFLNSIDDSVFSIIPNNWDGFIVDNYDIISIGNVLYTNFSIWLIISSLILLLAMVGAIIININRNTE